MAIFIEEFKHVFMCESAKEAWNILEITHKGTKMVKTLSCEC